MNPLGALGGMNPMGGMGGGPSPMGGGGSPLSPLADAIQPLANMDGGEDKLTPLEPITADIPPAGPPDAPGPAALGDQDPVEAPDKPGIEQASASAATDKPTVTLPDGKVVEAADPRAAEAAQKALDEASPGGDAAQKAYSETGVDLPSDGKNLGAKIDPADMQPGDVLQWHDKTMVAVAPGLVADPIEPGVTHTLADILKDDQTGFQGIFRPTETDPTLGMHNSPPPLSDPVPPAPTPPADSAPADPQPGRPAGDPPANPPADSVPLSGGSESGGPPAQAAPPSPFEQEVPPPAARTTRQDRIAAGQD